MTLKQELSTITTTANAVACSPWKRLSITKE